MENINVASVCLNQTPLNWEGNKSSILAALNDAVRHQARIVLFPELCVTGYGCEDAFLSPAVQETALQVLAEIIPECRNVVALFGVPLSVEGKLYNTAAVIADGRLIGFTAKQFLALEGIHYEPRWFHAWESGRQVSVEVLGNQVPVGDLLYEFSPIRFGIEICHDGWVEDRPAKSLIARGANLLLNMSASHFAFGKVDCRRAVVEQAVQGSNCGYVLSNLLGNEAGRAIYDGGALFAWDQKIQHMSRRLSFVERQINVAGLEVGSIPNSGDDSSVVASEYSIPAAEPVLAVVSAEEWEQGGHKKEEEFARAVALGLFDYLRKSRSRGFVVSLSGGADSSSVAGLCRLMIEFAIDELGIEEFKNALGYIPGLAGASSVDELTSLLLTCAYQGTKNSSDTTRTAARSLAQAVGAEFYEMDVGSLVQSYTEMVSSAVGHELTWEEHDLPLQNIQARVRGPGIWFIANLKGALLLATGNRSEVAVGYSTMDGDTCGGLSPIAGVDKTFLRRWLRWLEDDGPRGFGPIPILKLVNEQQPTAELRPADRAQTDEKDLMPYEVLDCIEELAIRDRLAPSAVFDELRLKYPNEENQQLGRWVERFFKLWSYNQWKRERYAPCFHLDDENLDPKTWCRFPILSGGYTRELAQLHEHIKNLEERE